MKPSATALSGIRGALERGEGVALAHDGAQVAAQAVVYRDETKGALLLWRRGEQAVWTSLTARCWRMLPITSASCSRSSMPASESFSCHAPTISPAANRSAFFDEFARRLSRIDRTRPSAAPLYVDLTNLKRLNALRGLEAGDTALAALAALLREHTRPGDLIARFGAGEFVLWIERIDVDGARARAAALHAAAARLAERVGSDLPFGICVGVAPFDPLRAETVMQLVLRAAADGAGANSGKEKGGEPWPASLSA